MRNFRMRSSAPSAPENITHRSSRRVEKLCWQNILPRNFVTTFTSSWLPPMLPHWQPGRGSILPDIEFMLHWSQQNWKITKFFFPSSRKDSPSKKLNWTGDVKANSWEEWVGKFLFSVFILVVLNTPKWELRKNNFFFSISPKYHVLEKQGKFPPRQ